MSDRFIEREFAGEVRRFELLPPDPAKLYRGFETPTTGTLTELAQRAAGGRLGVAAVSHILAHALSKGHPITLMRMQDLVAEELRKRPLAEFTALALDVIAAAYAGAEAE